MDMSDAPGRLHANTRVSKQDWTRAALDAIATQGVAGLRVEALAQRLGITKGSFYWHFQDRADLVAEALALWVRLGTTEVVAQLQTIPDPHERLRALFAQSFGDVVDGPIDALLLAQVDDEVVGDAVRRVTRERLAFLAECFRDLGLTPQQAVARAQVTYSAYVGATQLARAQPDDSLLPLSSTTFQDALEVLLRVE